MSTESAPRVIIIDDEENARLLLRRQLGKLLTPPEISEYPDKQAGIKAAQELEAAGIPFIAFVDGNLSSTSRNGEDGNEIIEFLKGMNRAVTIAFSGTGELKGADFQFGKDSLFQQNAVSLIMVAALQLLAGRQSGSPEEG